MSKVAIQGNASGTGTFTIAAPNSNTDRTLTLPDEAGTVLTSAGTDNFPAKTILQVQTVLKTDTWSDSATARLYSGDVTGLTVTITPKFATSKLLVMASVDFSNSVSPYRCAAGIFRDGSLSGLVGDAASNRTRVTRGRTVDTNQNSALFHMGFVGAEDAGSTASTTFSIRILNVEASDGTVYVNRSSSDVDANYLTRSASALTVMEIAQ